jgi:hypothetical protein
MALNDDSNKVETDAIIAASYKFYSYVEEAFHARQRSAGS